MTALLAKRRIIELSGLILFFSMISWSLTPTQSSALDSSPASDLYLYNTIDASPILDHGLAGADFTSSNSPKVVEFYDPKCGACQAFKYNYIEVAKKVRATRPDVEFYGVSCALHQSLCVETRVPKIIVFPTASSEGVEVQKGSGAIYFLSQRLLKALRSPEEIADESARLKSLGRRRLRTAAAGEDDDEDAYDSADVYMYEDNNSEEVDHMNKEETPPEPPEPEGDGDTQPADNKGDSTVETKWDLDKLVEIKGVPPDQWKPIHETDAWKNTMNELKDSDSQLGAQFLKWKHEHDAKLRAQEEQAEKEKNRLDSKINRDVERESFKAEAKEQLNNVAPPPPPKTIEINQSEAPPPQVFPPNLPPEQEKKFKEYIEKKRQAAIRKEQLKHPVKALLGSGTDTKTIEQKDKNQSPMNSYKSQYKANSESTQKDQKPKADLRPEAQQQSTTQKILSKVPIVKRAFNKHSHAHDTLNDAALSFTRGLMMGVFKGNTKGPLDYKRKKALKDWFDLLSVSLPPEMGLHDLLDTLNANIDSITVSEDNLNAIIKKHYIPDSNWSKSCTAEAGSLGK
jgi:hypothetical protein